MDKIKILIADDHTMFINGLKMLLTGSEKYAVRHTAQNGRQVLEVLENERVDIVLMDINMPVLNGYQTTFLIKEQFPEVKIVILSMLADEQSVRKLLKAGADGYLFKNTDEDELLKAFEAVMNDETYITKLIEFKSGSSRKQSYNESEEVRLSSREWEVAQLIAEGLTNIEIAEKLFISYRTAETHRKNILAKFNLKNTASLVKFLMDNKPFLEL